MTPQRGRDAPPDHEDPATAAARERVETVIAAFDRLTPDELARIGLSAPDPDGHAELLSTAVRAAEAAGRRAMLDDARSRTSDTILRRYSQGAIHPTWVTLNWGLSQGRTEDRVAIVEALQDAATAAVVADLVEPEVADALTEDAARVIGLAPGMASEGSLDRALSPAPPGYARRPFGWATVIGFAVVFGLVAASAGSTPFLAPFVTIAASVLAAVVRWRAMSGDRDGRSDDRPPRRGPGR